MLSEGFGLMAAGLGMVFAFLTLLVLMMKLSAGLFKKIPVSPPENIKASLPLHGKENVRNLNLEEIAVAIAAARSRAGE